ncbi:hypothetical protein [Stieleria varia]|uniref:MetA-pathway of phenol degradation n=1 Tax=Stieleria varia TaxID=2528005 RepID=A0A5C6B4L3_9BACT|nr:hypothetical protein [Stieleria varia]TWU06226.1 hypothetical protein Pla52n_19460 [Stieleria varia]
MPSLRFASLLIVCLGGFFVGGSTTHAQFSGTGGPPRPFGGGVVGSYSTGDGLGVSQWSANLRGGLPIKLPTDFLLLSPSYSETKFDLDGPERLPSKLFRVSLAVMWLHRVGEENSWLFGITPSLTGDRETLGETVRLFAMGMYNWQVVPDKLRMSLGVAYTGRADVPALPLAGLVWTPTEEWFVSLMMPKPKIARRVWGDSTASVWMYLGTELGGGTWDIDDGLGNREAFSYREFPLVLGIEQNTENFGRWFAEIGAGLGRRAEFENADRMVGFGESLFMQGGWNY